MHSFHIFTSFRHFPNFVCYSWCLQIYYQPLAGTTDNPCEVTDNPSPHEEEIQFILKEIRNYLSADVNGNPNLFIRRNGNCFSKI